MRKLLLFVMALTCASSGVFAQDNDDRELCMLPSSSSTPAKFANAQVWEVMLACDRVQYQQCSQMAAMGANVDRKCRYLLTYPPASKGYCTLQYNLAKKKNCWSPTNDEEFNAVGVQ